MIPLIIFWGSFFGALYMCSCVPVIGTQNYSTWETTTVGAQNTKCLNFCMFHTCNHGQCLQHPTSCKTWCECSDGFSGAQCDIQEQTIPTSPESIILTSDNLQSATQTATRGNIGKIFAESANFDVSQTIEKFEIFNNLEECTLRCNEGVCTSNDSSFRCIPKNCPNGFACQNGICEYKNNRGFRCVCEDGWVGDFCDSKCRLNCGKYGKCILNNGIESCVCDLDHSGKLCQKEISRNTTLPLEKSYQHFNACKSECDDLCIPLKQYYYCMPRKKNCPQGFPCLHYCDFGNDGRSVRCICEPGWIGDMCSRKCSMECGNHGICHVDDAGIEMCLCKINYTGLHCQQSISSNLK